MFSCAYRCARIGIQKQISVQANATRSTSIETIVDLVCKHGAAFQVLAKTQVQKKVRAATVLNKIEKECSRRADRKNNYAAKHSTMVCIVGRLS